MPDIVIVTGAASGIGLATARLLAKKYFVVGAFRKTPFTPQDGTNMSAFACDVANPEECLKLAQHAAGLGRLAGLVHCAAVNPTPAPSVTEMSPEFWRDILNNNLNSAFYLARAVVPCLLAGEGGSIVFVSSTAGRNGFSTAGGSPGHAKTAYATSKAGLIAFTKGLARELCRDNIRVNCVAAGPIDTRMLPNREETEKRVPMGRIGKPEEVAEAIAFMLDGATYTTGCTLDVCGGQYMN